MTEQNGKVTIQHLYNEIIPMIENIAGIKTDINNIKADVKDLKECTNNFISRPAFFAWLSAMSVVIGIAITLIKLL